MKKDDFIRICMFDKGHIVTKKLSLPLKIAVGEEYNYIFTDTIKMTLCKHTGVIQKETPILVS